jgi:hypothetical protein
MSVGGLIEAARLTPTQQSVDWEQAQEQLYMRLPTDYRQLVSAGGAGVWFNDLRLCSTTDLLLGVLHGTVSSQLFSDLFVDTQQVFRPYSEQP